ncbi:AAA family ATPase [Polyangium spumosum]|nr:ATP/GTP-binding protein [Polyangium spumosum]
MLLQFAVENFLSFREPMTLSLLATPGVEHDARQVLAGPEEREVLRCAAIYGANASGKSNLVKAIEFARRLILTGTRSAEPIGVRPFKLDEACRNAPSRFELEIGAGKSRYSYGFEVSERRVHSEWLFVATDGTEAKLFERSTDETDASSIEIGDALCSSDHRRQFLNFVAEGTRPNQLFLCEANERNATEFSQLISSVRELMVISPVTRARQLGHRLDVDESFRTFMGSLMYAAGTGIEELRVERIDPDDIDPMTTMQIALRGETVNEISAHTAGPVVLAFLQIKFAHRDRDGKQVLFSAEEESDGTRRLLHLGPSIYRDGFCYVIDELERSLHPLLTRMFLERFLAQGAIPDATPSQLIFTTHDTNLLDLSLLSRDSIWFTEKDPSGASTLYSLADFNPEQLADLGKNLENGYLQGRFGAIPFFGNLTRLISQGGRGS